MERQASILALDLATTIGWAWGPLSDPAPSDLEVAAGFKCEQPKGGVHSLAIHEKTGRRMHFYKKWLDETIQVFQPTIIVFEAPIPKQINANTARILLGMIGITDAIALEQTNVVYEIKVSDNKIHATGKGNASKGDMILAARNKGWKIQDDNHADALWLLDYTRATLGE